MKACALRMDTFRKKVVIARNQLIGHLDRKAVLAGVPLGAADEGEWNQFWLDLQDSTYCSVGLLTPRDIFTSTASADCQTRTYSSKLSERVPISTT